ncbi:metallophosphoesterase [Actinomyces minihominis]|uniref:metallophosphoesterase n=1 Tax=Actinomyces minihominis TaxID=2002838 RepID=UPI001F5C584C|nr:metallophosphoesterase [Actinomyces minihominis]
MLFPKFKEIGRRESLMGSQFVGFMRWTGGAIAGAVALGGAALVAAAVEARFPIVRRFDVHVPARPGLRETTILHISDLHMFERQGFIKKFLKRVAQTEQFDMVISTGDNLGSADAVPDLLDALQPLLEKPGAFVLGSNDYYSPEMKAWGTYLIPGHSAGKAKDKSKLEPDLPWVEMVNAMTEAGWIDLDNQAGTLHLQNGPEGEESTVALVGVDDPHIKRDRPTPPNRDWWEASSLRVGVMHAPYRRVLDRFANLDADLILAGHTHGGQIRIPLIGAIVTNSDISRRYSRGLHRWFPSGHGTPSFLHVSAGLGTSRYAPIRLFCRPEVSLLRFCPEE